MPFSLLRFADAALLAVATVVMFGVIIVAWYYANEIHRYAGIAVIAIGMIGGGYFWLRFVDRRSLGMLAQHLALITELITVGERDGNQKERSRELVEARIGDIEDLYVVRATVGRIFSQLTRSLRVADDHIPGLSFITRVVEMLRRASVPYLQAIIVSFAFARCEADGCVAAGEPANADLAESTRDGLALCIQNSNQLAKTSLAMVVYDFLLGLPVRIPVFIGSAYVIFVGVLASQGVDSIDMANKAKFMSNHFLPLFAAILAAGIGSIIISMFAARAFREAFTQPLLFSLLLLRFHNLVHGKPIEQSSYDKLDRLEGAVEQLDRLRYRAQQVV